MFTQRTRALRRGLLAVVAVVMATVLGSAVVPAHAAPLGSRFDQVNAVSDQPGVAPILDPLLVNPWGLALSPTSPVWVANNVSGTATLYRAGGGVPFAKAALVSRPGFVGGSQPCEGRSHASTEEVPGRGP
jgi:hypothetical protein